MDRVYWSVARLHDHEDLITTAEGVKLYDGDEKKPYYENGHLILTNIRLIWTDSSNEKICVALDLSNIVFFDEEAPSFNRSGKIVSHLSPAVSGLKKGPVSKSNFNHIKWSFSKGGHNEFLRQLKDVWGRRLWEPKKAATSSSANQISSVKTGIAGIELQIQSQQKKTESTINQAFEDLDALIAKAREMVTLSKSIASKIEQKQGNITEDETIRFKSCLLSMGIPDPVTRDTHSSNSKYLEELAKEINSALLQPIKETGGVMALTDAYCRINRARGMQLLSPQDLQDACKVLSKLNLPVTMKTYESGVVVLQLRSNNEDSVADDTAKAVEEKKSMSADEFAQAIGLSVVLAKERLLLAEQKGKLCRDDSVEGLRFYPNRFLTESK